MAGSDAPTTAPADTLSETVEQEKDRKQRRLTAYAATQSSDGPTPFVRITQPVSSNGATETASYLRLGGYTATGEGEAHLVPRLPVTYSVTECSTPGAQQNAAHIKLSDLPANQFSTLTQANQFYTIQSSEEIFSSNDGIFLYTNKDLIENVVGAGRTRYGTGHTVEVTGFDGCYNVKDGKYALSAKNGVFITAGRAATDTQKAYPANVEITALGYIKQMAYGDLNHVTYGNSTKETHGNTSEKLVGNKTTSVQGSSDDTFLGQKTTTLHGAENVFKFSDSNNLFIGTEKICRLGLRLSLAASAEFNVYVSAKVDLNFGKEYKLNLANAFNWVQGSDTKYIRTHGYKYVERSDYKKVPLNFLYLILNSVNQKMFSSTSEKSKWLAEIEERRNHLLSSDVTSAFHRTDREVYA